MGLQLTYIKAIYVTHENEEPKTYSLSTYFLTKCHPFMHTQSIFRNKVNLTPWSPMQGISRDFQEKCYAKYQFLPVYPW